MLTDFSFSGIQLISGGHFGCAWSRLCFPFFAAELYNGTSKLKRSSHCLKNTVAKSKELKRFANRLRHDRHLLNVALHILVADAHARSFNIQIELHGGCAGWLLCPVQRIAAKWQPYPHKQDRLQTDDEFWGRLTEELHTDTFHSEAIQK